MAGWKAILLFTLMGNLFSVASWGQVARGEFGSVHSPKQIGLTYMRTAPEGEPWTLCRLVADIWDVVRGECDTPGVKFQYNICYPLRSWTSLIGTGIDLVAGPGITTGFVKDHDADRFYAIAGLCGMIGAYHHFAGNVAVGIDFTGEIAISARGRNFGSTRLAFYKHGLSQSIMPEISITYRF